MRFFFSRKETKKKASKNKLAKSIGGPGPHKNVPKLYARMKRGTSKSIVFCILEAPKSPFWAVWESIKRGTLFSPDIKFPFPSLYGGKI